MRQANLLNDYYDVVEFFDIYIFWFLERERQWDIYFRGKQREYKSKKKNDRHSNNNAAVLVYCISFSSPIPPCRADLSGVTLPPRLTARSGILAGFPGTHSVVALLGQGSESAILHAEKAC